MTVWTKSAKLDTSLTKSPMAEHQETGHDDVVYPQAVPFVLVHLGCVAAVWTGVSAQALWMAFGLYVVRMFGITAGYHRYFSHRSFKTSRTFQFLLAWLAQSSAQRGVLWWAAKHREHHRHSDTPADVHSPRHHGFFFSHIGWVYAVRRGKADFSHVRDLARFPELVWLDRQIYLPALVLALMCFWAGGWSGLVVGFGWSTVALYHATFAINSFAHLWGTQRYYTGDDSRNNGLLAVLTLGEGWHNNHHYYMGAARQGFFRWEWDPTYLILRLLQSCRIVWDICEPTSDVLSGQRRLSRSLIERAAHEVADHWVGPDVDRQSVEERARELVGPSPSREAVVDRALVLLESKFEHGLTGASLGHRFDQAESQGSVGAPSS